MKLKIFFLWLMTISLWAGGSSVQDLKGQLKTAFDRAQETVDHTTDETAYLVLLQEIKLLRQQIQKEEEASRLQFVKEQSVDQDTYGLWDLGESTLSQLVMEYGSNDYLYVIPQELSAMKISLFSGIPLPRESWNELLDIILGQNGIGVRKLHSFVKQLYVLKLDAGAVQGVVSREDALDLFPNHARIFFVLSPPPEQLRTVQAFFEKFSDPKQTVVQLIGSKLALVGTKDTIATLLSLYHGVWEKSAGKVIRLFYPTKVSVAEAEKILRAVFSDSGSKGRPPYYPNMMEELTMMPLSQGLVLIGEEHLVDRGEEMLKNLESQLDDPGEKVIYWYCCKHSNPEDIAQVLEKVYESLIGSHLEKKEEAAAPPPPHPQQPPPPDLPPGPLYPPANTPFYPVLPATAPFVQPGLIDKNQKIGFGSFIVDIKTTSILMVIRREELGKIKALLKKLDVPKRMVQLDVLLVEKKLTDRKQIGVNLLQLGSTATNTTKNALSFDNQDKGIHKGILSFLFSRTGGDHGPAFDLTYNFLMAQEDVKINANPSVLAINQTPATVSIVEEISIDNGAIPVQLAAGGVTFERSFTRAQYGITINLTPTIHLAEGDGPGAGFVSLDTNLEFDTTLMSHNDRPPVNRRHVENQVCVADGETVILGGLRRKMQEDTREKFPFLSDLPGIGKLFGMTKMHDTTTEMFIFITPKIIHHPVDDLRKIRQAEYQKRAGDIPEFLAKLDAAKSEERKSLFDNSLRMLFDMY
jgi:general secretion pathway protein D